MNPYIYKKNGALCALNVHPKKLPTSDVAVIIVNRNRPDLTDKLVVQVKNMKVNIDFDVFVIEMGSDKDKCSKFMSFYYADPGYRGKCYGHNVGLRLARATKDYKYYWVMMNDLVYPQRNAMQVLYDVCKRNPNIGILSPTEPESNYTNCKPKPGKVFHTVSTCDYLSLFIKKQNVEKAGFLNPDFLYCWGAIHEYAYKTYKIGNWVAYCDLVTMKHLGGTTYGKVKGVLSRPEYKRQASIFAARYFVQHYGPTWDTLFSQVLPGHVEINAFPAHRRIWEEKSK